MEGEEELQDVWRWT